MEEDMDGRNNSRPISMLPQSYGFNSCFNHCLNHHKLSSTRSCCGVWEVLGRQTTKEGDTTPVDIIEPLPQTYLNSSKVHELKVVEFSIWNLIIEHFQCIEWPITLHPEASTPGGCREEVYFQIKKICHPTL